MSYSILPERIGYKREAASKSREDDRLVARRLGRDEDEMLDEHFELTAVSTERCRRLDAALQFLTRDIEGLKRERKGGQWRASDTRLLGVPPPIRLLTIFFGRRASVADPL